MLKYCRILHKKIRIKWPKKVIIYGVPLEASLSGSKKKRKNKKDEEIIKCYVTSDGSIKEIPLDHYVNSEGSLVEIPLEQRTSKADAIRDV